jgi:hypothetical protein
MNLNPLPIRLFCDLATPNNVIDLNVGSGSGAFFYRGDDIQIDIGLGNNGALLTGLGSSGAGGIASVTLQLFEDENDTNAPMMAATVLAASMNLNLTAAQWANNTNTGSPIADPILPTAYQHASFIIPNSQTAISLNGQTAQNYWLRITVLTTDTPAKTITFLDGPITVKDGPISTTSPPVPAWFRFYTVDGNIVPQLYDPVSGHYYNLEIDTVGGVRILSLGDTAY